MKPINTKSEFYHGLLGMVDEYIGLSRIESNELGISLRPAVDFSSEVVDPSLTIVDSLAQDARMIIERDGLDNPLPATCDPALMGIVMVNLLGNAIKYGSREGTIRIRARTEDSRLKVSVWNEGPGFPPEEKPRLFRKFSRLQTPELLKRKGTGVGLYSTWRIVQLHGGRIWAESEPGQWAEFSFEIPLAHGGTAGKDGVFDGGGNKS